MSRQIRSPVGWRHPWGFAWLALLLAACVFSPGRAFSAGVSSDAPPAARRGGELRIALPGMPATLNPALTAAAPTTVPGAQLFASLFRLDAGFEPRAYLAKRWRLADDGLTLTVELVKDARFHDGRPVTSRDVAFSIEAVRDHHSFSTMLSAVERVETPDARTAVIRLRHPHPVLFIALSAPLTPILPAHIYGDGRPLREHPANRAPVGSGPFRFVRWEPTGRIVMERFDGFFLAGRPYLDRLVFDVYPDPAQIPFALAAGEVQFTPLLPVYTGADLIETKPGLVAARTGLAGIGMMQDGFTFNLRRPPFNDRRVRQAIAYAIDRDHLSNTLLKGKLVSTSGPFPPDHPFANDAMERYRTDVARANRLLDEAGYLRNHEGFRFRVEYLAAIDEPVVEASGEYLHWDLRRKLGIDVVPVVTTGVPEWLRRMAAGDFEMSLDIRLMWGDPLLGLHRTYHSNAIRADGLYTNYAAYANPEVDALLDAAGRELDPDRRKALYHRFQDLVAEDLPYFWMCNTPLRFVAARDLAFPTDSPWAPAQPYDQVYWGKIVPSSHRTHPSNGSSVRR